MATDFSFGFQRKCLWGSSNDPCRSAIPWQQRGFDHDSFFQLAFDEVPEWLREIEGVGVKIGKGEVRTEVAKPITIAARLAEGCQNRGDHNHRQPTGKYLLRPNSSVG